MSRASPILVCPTVHLRQLPEEQKAYARNLLFECIQGVDAKHHKRWMDIWRGLFNAEPGEVTEFLSARQRSLPYHQRWMAIEQRIFDNQEAFVHQERFRDWLKTGAGWGRYQVAGERMVFVPASISYEAASDAEMREFVEAAQEFLHTPRAQRKLWPSIKAAQRADMLETLMRNPREQSE